MNDAKNQIGRATTASIINAAPEIDLSTHGASATGPKISIGSVDLRSTSDLDLTAVCMTAVSEGCIVEVVTIRPRPSIAEKIRATSDGRPD